MILTTEGRRPETRRTTEEDKETVADAFKTQKNSVKESFCEQDYCAHLTGGPLMGDPAHWSSVDFLDKKKDRRYHIKQRCSIVPFFRGYQEVLNEQGIHSNH